MNQKIEIVVTEGHRFVPSVYNGIEFVSVDYNSNSYGGGSPCINETDVQIAIDHARNVIRQHNDIPILNDKRKKATLVAWIK